MNGDLNEPAGPIYAPGQLALTLPAGTRIHAAPRKVWQRWTREEQLEIEMNDAIGSYSTGRFVEVWS